ncbi:MAG TPA: hypothetical protein VJL29_11640 [Thermoguttaceae bacterium]|nr:hypothetical protein [Thermoguttaceae bacterium]
MTKGNGGGRKTQRIVRAPATKFGHMQKKARSIREAGKRFTTKNAK